MMGWAARTNPVAFPGTSERAALTARVQRVCDAFPTREAYEQFLSLNTFTPDELAFMEALLPSRLQVQGTV